MIVIKQAIQDFQTELEDNGYKLRQVVLDEPAFDQLQAEAFIACRNLPTVETERSTPNMVTLLDGTTEVSPAVWVNGVQVTKDVTVSHLLMRVSGERKRANEAEALLNRFYARQSLVEEQANLRKSLDMGRLRLAEVETKLEELDRG